MSASFALLPVSLEDGARLVRAQHLGFAGDAFNRASFPNVPLDVKVQDSVERWPANFLAPGGIYMKTVHRDTGEIIGYSKWQADAAFTNALKEKFGTNAVVEGAEKLERRDPVGLNDDLAEEMSANILACRKSVLGNRPHISEVSAIGN
jgi:hypothetical protein